MGYVDAHVHVGTPDTAHDSLAAGWKKEQMQSPSFTPEELFKHCRPAGVDRVNLIQTSFHGIDKPVTVYLVRMPRLFGGRVLEGLLPRRRRAGDGRTRARRQDIKASEGPET